MVTYLAQLYCICVVWNTLDGSEIVRMDLHWNHVEQDYPQMIWLKYEAYAENQTDIDDLVRLGIDSDCQVKGNTKLI